MPCWPSSKTQELAGIDVVADGELYRWDINHAETNGMIDFFVRPMEGVEAQPTRAQLQAWQASAGMAFRAIPPGIVVGPLAAGHLDLAADYERFRCLTQRPKKFTITSPYMLAKTLGNQYYETFAELLGALADVLASEAASIKADVVQIDEANITGHPQDAQLAAQAINRVLSAVQGEKAVHLCFGNYGGQTVQRGTYQALVEFLNALQADHLVLEMARRPAQELQLLERIDARLGIGLGVIDIKDNEVETADVVAQRIADAATIVGPERMHYIHPDCGFWMLPRSVADAKMSAMVAGRDLFLGQ